MLNLHRVFNCFKIRIYKSKKRVIIQLTFLFIVLHACRTISLWANSPAVSQILKYVLHNVFYCIAGKGAIMPTESSEIGSGFVKIFYGILITLAICAGLYSSVTPLVSVGGFFDQSIAQVLGTIMSEINGKLG